MDLSHLVLSMDDLFEAMVERVIIRSQTEVEFYFESGQVIAV